MTYQLKESIYTQRELMSFLADYPLEEVNKLRTDLGDVGYHCNNILSLKVLLCERLRSGSMMLSGDPGAGKTSLFNALIKVYKVPSYRLDCYSGITGEQALYKFNERIQSIRLEALFKNDPNPSAKDIHDVLYDVQNISYGPLGKAYTDDIEDCFILINEIDKIPAEERFEALLLTYIDEYSFIIPELNVLIKPKTKRNPLIVITSNAGAQHGGSAVEEGGNGIKVLSYPLQRRGTHLHLSSPNMARTFQIVQKYCPKLDKEVIRQIVLYVARLGFVRRSNDSSNRDMPIRLSNSKLEKPIGTSEVIDWARGLEWMYEKYAGRLPQDFLIPEFVALTVERLVKTQSDQNTLTVGLTDDIRQVQESKWDLDKDLDLLIQEDAGVVV